MKRTEGIHVVSAGNLYRIIASGSQTEQRFSAIEMVLEPGQGAPFHTHDREDESFFVLEGCLSFYLGNKEFRAYKEDFVSCPPGVVRGFRNNTDAVARALLLYSSAGVEEMIERSGKVVDRGTKASDVESRPGIQCPTLAEEYGIAKVSAPLPCDSNIATSSEGEGHA
ncbi:cupin domain-containing protein [Roseiconus lacunae]|uniref:cupin domain-containing protein n=1 Tax=Roseiconus lacunae TaxID=2605694 RepID=UPI0011F24388